MSGHTEGPWLLAVGSDQMVHNGPKWIASTMGTKGPEGAANARLIAAAPDLLAVLQDMFCDGPVQVALAGNPTACDALEQRARAAILKATTPA